MAEVRSTNIIPIGAYCIVLGIFFLSMAANMILGSKALSSGDDLVVWIPVVAAVILAIGLIAVGIGIINVNQVCWKILFFCLAICVSSIASLLIAFLIFLTLGVNIISPFLESNQLTPVMEYSFFPFFLSEIIVLYYLTTQEVVSSFGDMGELISPF